MIWEVSSDQTLNNEFPLMQAIRKAMIGQPIDVKSCARDGGSLTADFAAVAPMTCPNKKKTQAPVTTKAPTQPSSANANSGGANANANGGANGGGGNGANGGGANDGGGANGGGGGGGGTCGGSCGCSGGPR